MATKLIKGRVKKPANILIYGVAGVGKSILASGFPRPVMIGPEENDEVELAARFPKVNSYNQMMGYLNEIISGQHDREKFQTVIIDTIDMFEKSVIHKEIEKSEGRSMVLARGGFGKAYKESRMKLGLLRERLEILRDKKKMNIIILGHSVKVKFTDPMVGADYDMYELPLHKDANEIFTDWCSAVLFMNWKKSVNEQGFAVGTDQRALYTEYRPAHLAKNRYGFPYEIVLKNTNDPRENAKIILDMIDEFYDGKRSDNSFESEIIIIQKQTMEAIENISDSHVKKNAIHAYKNSEYNLEKLIEIRNYAQQIVGGNA